jgi:hypothetical protein
MKQLARMTRLYAELVQERCVCLMSEYRNTRDRGGHGDKVGDTPVQVRAR